MQRKAREVLADVGLAERREALAAEQLDRGVDALHPELPLGERVVDAGLGEVEHRPDGVRLARRLPRPLVSGAHDAVHGGYDRVLALVPGAGLEAADLVDLRHVLEHRVPLVPYRWTVGDHRRLRKWIKWRMKPNAKISEHAVGVAVGVDRHLVAAREEAGGVRDANLLERRLNTKGTSVTLALLAVEEVHGAPGLPPLRDGAAVGRLVVGVLPRPRPRAEHRRGVAAVRRRTERRRRPDRVRQIPQRPVRDDPFTKE